MAKVEKNEKVLKYKPQGSFVLCRALKSEKKNKSGIILPNENSLMLTDLEYHPVMFEVVYENEELTYKEGDKLITPYDEGKFRFAERINGGNEELFAIRKEHVLAVFIED